MTIFLGNKGGGGSPPYYRDEARAGSYRAGAFYPSTLPMTDLDTNVSGFNNQIGFMPFTPFASQEFDAMAITVASVTSGSANMGVYDSGSDGLPDNLLAETTSFTLAAGVNIATLSSPQTLSASTRYWLAYNANASNPVYTGLTSGTGTLYPVLGVTEGLPDYAVPGLFGFLTQSQAFGTMPSSVTPTGTTTLYYPLICMRAS